MLVSAFCLTSSAILTYNILVSAGLDAITWTLVRVEFAIDLTFTDQWLLRSIGRLACSPRDQIFKKKPSRP
jgi:hypothetical protein